MMILINNLQHKEWGLGLKYRFVCRNSQLNSTRLRFIVDFRQAVSQELCQREERVPIGERDIVGVVQVHITTILTHQVLW